MSLIKVLTHRELSFIVVLLVYLISVNKPGDLSVDADGSLKSSYVRS